MKLALLPLLRERGIRQTQFAEQLEITPGYMSLLINGQREPSPALLQRMAEALGVGVGDLLGDARGPGFADRAEPYGGPRAHERDFLKLFAGQGRRLSLYRMTGAAMKLGFMEGDLLAMDIGRRPDPGETVLATEADAQGNATTFVARWLDPWIDPGDPSHPPARVDESGACAVMGVVVGALRL